MGGNRGGAGGRRVPGPPPPRPSPQEPWWQKGFGENLAGAGRRREAPRTVEDVLKESEAREEPSAAGVVLDMRGPQVRVVQHTGELGADPLHAGAKDPTPFPEVQHGLKLALDLFEADVRRAGEQLRRAEETAEAQERSLAQLNEASTSLEGHQRRAAGFRQRLASCEEAASVSRGVALQDLASIFVGLQDDYPAEYASFRCADVALGACGSRFADCMAGWDPFLSNGSGDQGDEGGPAARLAFSKTGLLELAAWQSPLDTLSARQEAHEIYPEEGADSDPFLQLVFSVFIPPLRSSVNAWDPSEPQAFVGFMEAWGKVFPSQALAYIYGHLLLPKLKRALDAWSPRSGTPLQLWLHPWLPLAAEHLRQLLPDVRHRLGAALRKWHPSEPAAGKELLLPWKNVLDGEDWEGLVGRAVVPRLGEVLGTLSYSTDGAMDASDRERLDDVLAWVGVAPAHLLVPVFAQHFFPNWRGAYQQILRQLPVGDGGVVEEADAAAMHQVARWYEEWKATFPEELLAAEVVRAEFNQLLTKMNRAALGGAPLPEEPKPVPKLESPLPSGKFQMGHLSLKDLVEGYAAEVGLGFVPKGRDNDGRQVYLFGKVSVTLDSNKELIHAALGGIWEPVTLARLVQENGRG